MQYPSLYSDYSNLDTKKEYLRYSLKASFNHCLFLETYKSELGHQSDLGINFRSSINFDWVGFISTLLLNIIVFRKRERYPPPRSRPSLPSFHLQMTTKFIKQAVLINGFSATILLSATLLIRIKLTITYKTPKLNCEKVVE